MSYTETIFITGFPGFIAERLVARLARPDVQFYLLVQKSYVEAAMRAVERIAASTETPEENFALVEGDISLRHLGIADEDFEVLRTETNTIYHLAAVYDLAVDRELAFRVNLDGTKNVNEFA